MDRMATGAPSDMTASDGEQPTAAGAGAATETEPRPEPAPETAAAAEVRPVAAAPERSEPARGPDEPAEPAEEARPERTRRWPWPLSLLENTADRRALIIWLLSHIGFFYCAALSAPGRTEDPWLFRLTRWDAENFIAIAEYGYDGPPDMEDREKLPAFFPGMPLLIRLLQPIVPDGRLATVLISLVASAVVAVSLSRLAESIRPGSGQYATAALFFSPFAAFLYCGYSEALFLALAIPAWSYARQGRWELAAVLAAGAATVRITGLFLAFGLLIMYLVGEHGRKAPGGWRKLPWLVVPGLPVLLYSFYHWTRTGDWFAYNTVQERFWGRHPVWPWEAFRNTWEMSDDVPQLTLSYYEEIASAGVLLLATIILAARRRWPEAAYLFPQVLAFMTLSSFYLSVGRGSLLWLPLWVAIGVACSRRWWLWCTYLVLAVPVMVLNVGNFTTGAWIG